MDMEQAIILTIPFLALVVVLEMIVSIKRGRKTYRTNDTLANLSQGLISQLVAACTPLLQIGIYALVFMTLGYQVDSPFWHSWYGFAVAVVLFDFCEYWLHRAGHEIAIFWAAHTVHHQGEELNICTALRQESQNAVLGWPFYLPMAFLGVPPDIFGFSLLFVQYYQIWAHTEQVGKLGWLDGVVTTPSNHRVHHASNDIYLDKNYGGVLIIFDHLFGTYAKENDQIVCLYGLVTPIDSVNPFWIALHEWIAIIGDVSKSHNLSEALNYLFSHPGWRPESQTDENNDLHRLSAA